MKLQAILFILLQAQGAALSNDESSEKAIILADGCASPCKRNLRLSALKMEECLRAHCGSPEDVVDIEVSGDHESCVSRCNKLRFGPTRQRQCIKDCDDEYGAGKESSFNAPSIPSGGGSSGPDRDPEQCEAGCRRLRFSLRKQMDCIRDCHADEDGYEYDEEEQRNEAEISIDASDEKEDPDFPRNDDACVSRCKRLRFSHAMQVACIGECNEGDKGSSQSGFDSEGDRDRGASPGDSGTDQPNPCVARCMRLRFSAARQADCVSKCPTDDFHVAGDTEVQL